MAKQSTAKKSVPQKPIAEVPNAETSPAKEQSAAPNLDRLIHDYGWSAHGLTRGYVWLCALSGLLVVSSHGFFALRALQKKD